MAYEDFLAKRSFFYSLPLTIGAFFRELLAVTLVLTLQERMWGVDMFTQGLVLLLVLITFRVPYINSYTLLFEAFCIGDWKISNHLGLRKHDDVSQNMLHVLVIFVAHVGGAIGAAALRGYLDVTYGTEIPFGKEGIGGLRTTLAPALEVDVDGLKRFDSFWGASSRVDRLGNVNGTLLDLIPFTDSSRLGISPIALTVWYTTEEIGYVFLLCVCYIHIWLSAGVGENKKPPLNPFVRKYWNYLFKVCLLITLIYVSLYRAFPTAHGSLHTTIFKVQYQAWNPNVRMVDADNSETFARIFGGFLGLMLAVGYNKALVGTEKADQNDEGDFYYKFIWGLEPDPNHTRAKRLGNDDGESSDEEGGWNNRRGRRMYCSSYDVKHCDANGRCTSGSCTICQGQPLTAKKTGFKLRIPHVLDHPK